MKKLVSILSVTLLALGFCGSAAIAQQAPEVLTNLNFDVVGVGVNAGPDYQAVPKGVNSQVLTSLAVQNADVNEIIKFLQQD